MKNIEIKLDLHCCKKVILTGLACMLAIGIVTIDKSLVKAATSSMLLQTTSTDTQSYTYYREAKSDPKKISFTQSTIKVEKYGKVYIPSVMKILPKVANTTPNTEGIKYWTGNSKIASVTDDVITAKKEGRTWLYVETPNKVKAKVSILVTPHKDYSRVSLVEKSTKIGLKQTLNVKDYVFPTLTASDGDVFSIIKANRKYTYRIGNSKIAKVTADGIVKALAKGKTWLYVKSESGYENRISLNIVDEQNNAKSIKLPTTLTVNMKEKVKLKAIVSPTNSKVASWRIGNPKVAVINQSGIVTGVSVGNTYAYAKVANGKEVRSLIKVKNPDCLSVDVPYVNDMLKDGDALAVNREKTELTIRRTVNVEAKNTPDFSLLKAKTGNSKIAVVSRVEDATKKRSYVTVKAISSGTTWLNIETADGLKCKILLKVKKPALKEFSMPDKITISKNDSAYINASVDDYYQNSVNYRIGNSKIAKVNEAGELIGISEGLTNLYTECNGKTLKTLISVKSNPTIKNIKLDKNVVNINVKKSKFSQINAIVNPINTINPKLTYKVGNEKIAEVYQNGTIFGRSNGSTYVYATAENGVTTKALVKVSGFDEIKQIKAPKTIETNLSENTPGDKKYNWKGQSCRVTFNTSYGNKPEDIKVYIGNESIAKLVKVTYSSSGILVYYDAKAQGNTYLYFEMPNGKVTKTLLKVHW